MKILIDGDGCPVIDLTVEIATKYDIPVTLVCDTAHIYDRQDIQMIIVGKGRDASDFELMQHVKKNDVIITQDYGLAAMALTKQAYVMNQNGMEYTTLNIDQLLFSRHMAQKVRKAGGRLKGPNKRTSDDDQAFEQAFERLLMKIETQ